jgi:hypothetical protein
MWVSFFVKIYKRRFHPQFQTHGAKFPGFQTFPSGSSGTSVNLPSFSFLPHLEEGSLFWKITCIHSLLQIEILQHNCHFPPASWSHMTHRQALSATATKIIQTTLHLCPLLFKYWLLLCVVIGFNILFNSVSFCTNCMWNVVPLESVRENFVTNFPGL